MESVDCWSLAIIPIQTLGGKSSYSSHPSGCDCSLVTLIVTVNGTAKVPYVSGVRAFTRVGPHVESNSDQAIGCDPCGSQRFCAGDPDARSLT
jgi:hypothetical protein